MARFGALPLLCVLPNQRSIISGDIIPWKPGFFNVSSNIGQQPKCIKNLFTACSFIVPRKALLLAFSLVLLYNKSCERNPRSKLPGISPQRQQMQPGFLALDVCLWDNNSKGACPGRLKGALNYEIIC